MSPPLFLASRGDRGTRRYGLVVILEQIILVSC